MAQHIIFSEECPMYSWEECVFCCFLDGMFYGVLADPSGPKYGSNLTSFFIFSLDDLSKVEMGVLKSPTLWGASQVAHS